MRIPICVALGVTTILFGILGVNACCMVHVGSGERNGIVVKLADEGFFKKTHELEIIRGGMNGGSGSFGVKPFYATIPNDRDFQTLQSAYEQQKEVYVTYDEYMLTFASECNGSEEHCSFVSSVRVK